MSSTTYFIIRGVVEGFYGFYYTHQERLNLLSFLGLRGYNFYLYAPKNDRHHRDQWRLPYPHQAQAMFKETVQTAIENDIQFCYGISPGTSICYSSSTDFFAIQKKYTYFYEMGVRSFALLLDDILPEFRYPEDQEQYTSYAQAHADLCNRIDTWLKTLDPDCQLSMCPTDYADTPPFSAYTRELGEKLKPEIMIMYTGVDVCAEEIRTADAKAYGEAAQRKPLIWDNYPVNDGAMAADIHLGPIQGRDPDLYTQVSGILVNPMNQMEASKIALATYGEYLANPLSYDPQTAWQRALKEAAGPAFAAALQTVAENALKSPLKTPNAVKLERLVTALMASLKSNVSVVDGHAVAALDQYLTDIDEATYLLANYMQNDALRNDLLPWLALCDEWRRLGKNGIEGIRLLDAGADFQKQKHKVKELVSAIQKHPKRIMGTSLMELADWLLAQAEGDKSN